ncbi:VOC family protein [Actinomadura viridis]|uniref:VOC family protein n=1 Tax=Actinomadura viridis TaxID=58110 RepID=UPI00367562E2
MTGGLLPWDRGAPPRDSAHRHLELTLMVPGPPSLDPESAGQLRALIAKGVLGAGAFHTDDCRAEYERLSARGVEFVQKPERRPYGIEAIFRDDSGNWFSLTEPFERLDENAPWEGCEEG